MAGRRAARPGADHHRLHAALCADGRPRAAGEGPLSHPGGAVAALRGAAGVPGDLPARRRLPEGLRCRSPPRHIVVTFLRWFRPALVSALAGLEAAKRAPGTTFLVCLEQRGSKVGEQAETPGAVVV